MTALDPLAAQNQIPVLCVRCLAPAEARGDGSVVCHYCGEHGMLPPDQLGRMLELSRRIQQASNAALQMQGTEAALSHIYESRAAFVRVSGLCFVVSLVVLAGSLVNSWGSIERAPVEYRAPLLINSLIGPFAVAGIGVALCFALAISRVSYRRRVRPLLFARAPRASGLPARCRVCGAPLSDQRAALVACEYCRTQNLVTTELARDRERLLAEEYRFYQGRGHQVLASTTRTALSSRRVLIIAFVLVYLSMVGLAGLANSWVS